MSQPRRLHPAINSSYELVFSTSGCWNYSFQPVGAQLRHKIEAIARQAMQGVGGQEVALPLVQPADLFPGRMIGRRSTSPPAC